MTGASGFIGSELSRRLRSRGDSVIPVTRSAPEFGQVGVDLQAERLDLSKMPGGTLEGIDACVHLAGAPISRRWTPKAMAAIRSSRIDLGGIVANSISALERRPAVYVTGSAIGIYGDRGDEILDEKSPTGTGTLADICTAWEAAALPATRAGIRTVAIRTGIVLGHGGALGVQVPLFKLGLGGRIGDGRQWVSWISLEDEVRIVLRALDDASMSGPVNATAPEPVRNAEFTATLASVLHRPAVLPAPVPALKLLLGAGAAEELLLASQRVRPGALEQLGYEFRRPRLEDALSAAVA